MRRLLLCSVSYRVHNMFIRLHIRDAVGILANGNDLKVDVDTSIHLDTDTATTTPLSLT